MQIHKNAQKHTKIEYSGIAIVKDMHVKVLGWRDQGQHEHVHKCMHICMHARTRAQEYKFIYNFLHIYVYICKYMCVYIDM